MFILSDAGMGKTSLLTMLKLLHLTSFWPSQKDCVLMKLGEGTLDELDGIPNKRETILLLDSLDEDPEAYGRVKDRLLEILRASQHFFRVIISCRTQFFPEVDKDRLERLGMVAIGGFSCPVKFLSFFSDEKVTAYLNKRFPKKFGLLPNTEKLEQARQVIQKMGSLRCRPMLLAYIEDLMKSPLLTKENSEYLVYEALVQSWLDREQLKDPQISVKDLLDACVILATWLQMKKRRSIGEAELNRLIEQIAKVRAIRDIHIKGRSLLNRNSEGDYRFSHYTVQEFLVAKLFLDKPPFKPVEEIPVTDFMFRMITASPNKNINFPELFGCTGLNLKQFDFSGMDLSDLNLSGLNLEKCVFENTGLNRTAFRNARLCGSRFDSMPFAQADLRDADLTGARLINPLGMVFVYIPPGTFQMGDEYAGPIHEVMIEDGFFLQTTPVTQGQWQAVMADNPSHFKKCGADCPVENVSWNDVQTFIQKLNEMEEKVQYSLPAEAQWEYACRAGSTSRYCFGDDERLLPEYAWFNQNSKNSPHPVGQLKPNDFGLYDMHGNVWEWCEDQWHGSYEGAPPDGRAWVDSEGHDRVLRGGSWISFGGLCRSANRSGSWPSYRSGLIGFRLSRGQTSQDGAEAIDSAARRPEGRRP